MGVILGRLLDYLNFSLIIKTTGSCSSQQKPRSDSRHLYAGHHLANNQITAKLILEDDTAPSFDVFCTYRRIYDGSFAFVFLIHTCQINLTFPLTLTTVTLNESRLRWFETCFWKPISKGHFSFISCYAFAQISSFS